jgi:hypothetical protein
MVKRKLKQRTGDLTVIVNVGGVPTKKGRKKRGKSRARGGSVRPAKNFVVSYTDQTPTLNLLKEFSETNRLLLTGQNNLAPPARLTAGQSDPSVMGSTYSIDTTRLDPPRPNRLTPQSSVASTRPDTTRNRLAPVALRGTQRVNTNESQDLSGFTNTTLRGRRVEEQTNTIDNYFRKL